ncbi:MAG: hypothetical protein GF408_05450 [Candidatus Omnitrophica bacterium]|nr:hypothetical protein [Candidatus Omnitrophota bacterium]
MILLILTAGIFFGLRYFFLKSAFFKVSEIVVNKDKGYSFYEGEKKLRRLYTGSNIFNVDLKRAKRIIGNDYPHLRGVEVRRSLPDRIAVDIISRKPAAVIDSNGGVVIDREAVVLAIGETPEGLLTVKGINFFISIPSRGERVENSSLEKALDLIDGLKLKMRESSRSRIDHIDISDSNNILLVVDGVEVKMGTDDFPGKIDKLNQILADPAVNFRDISYIDLRFSEAVISPK